MQPFANKLNKLRLATTQVSRKSFYVPFKLIKKIHGNSIQSVFTPAHRNNQYLFKYQKYVFSVNAQEQTHNETKEDDDDDDIEEEFIEPQYDDYDPHAEHAFDPQFDNEIHGVFTRKDYEKRQGRAESEVGKLGRLFIYQYNCCPFCGKIKSVLDYYNIPYSLIECNPISKNELPNRKKFLHDRTVPILIATQASPGPHKYAVDQKITYKSNVIIKTLLEYLSINGIMPQNEYERGTSDIINAWQDWMDNNLIPHIYAAIDYESVQGISYINKLFNDGKNKEGEENSVDILFRYLKEFHKFETMAITTFPIQTMCVQLFHHQAKQIRFKYGIPNGYDIDYLKNVLHEWHEVTKISFHGGSKPDLADLMCFGILRTFNNIPFMKQVLKETQIDEWYDTMEELVGAHSCITHA